MDETVIARIGAQIRTYRLSTNLSIQELADAAGVSKGLISRLENGRMICSLPVLMSIISVFNISLADFFAGVDMRKKESVIIIKENDYKLIEKEYNQSGFTYQSIINKLIGNLPIEIVLLSIQSGAKRRPVQTDAYEYKYILEGQINYHFDDKIVVLEKGDSLFFDGRIPHYPYNAGTEDVKMLVIYFYQSNGELSQEQT